MALRTLLCASCKRRYDRAISAARRSQGRCRSGILVELEPADIHMGKVL